jgi:hypothetical protein
MKNLLFKFQNQLRQADAWLSFAREPIQQLTFLLPLKHITCDDESAD